MPVVIIRNHRVWEYSCSPLVRFGRQVLVRVLAPGEPSDLAGDMNPSVVSFPSVMDGRNGYPYETDPDFHELAARVAEHRFGQR